MTVNIQYVGFKSKVMVREYSYDGRATTERTRASARRVKTGNPI